MFSLLDNLMALQTLKFNSEKQKKSVSSKLLLDKENNFYKLHKQWNDGSITLYNFYKITGTWYGHAITVGKRGGEKTYHKCFVVENNGKLDLYHT